MTDRPLGTESHPQNSTTDVAKDQAKSVAGDAKQSGQQVAETAKEQTREVAAEAKDQARQLYQQVRGEFGDQAATQHQRAAKGLRTLGDELGSMARGSEQSGVATDLARQASDRVNSLAGWLESREPGDLVSELTSFARRKPGTFLAAAAAVGFLGGRLTRGIAAESSSSDADAQARYSGAEYGPGTQYGPGSQYGSGTEYDMAGSSYNPGPATDAPAATTQPRPLPTESGWPEPDGGAVPPTGVGSTTGVSPGTGEERI
jgi:hypothetical protein